MSDAGELTLTFGTCRKAWCPLPARGTPPGRKPSPDDELCITHALDMERLRRQVKSMRDIVLPGER